MNSALFARTLVIVLLQAFVLTPSFADTHEWQVLQTVPFKGKQDDIFFGTRRIGWYVNGAGFIYKTVDGGDNWKPQIHQPGTYFRAIHFIDKNTGFAGNIGPDYFPGATDEQPLYGTRNGGKTWVPIRDVSGKELKGICAIDSVKTKFINAGHLDERTTIYAAGRVGGPARMAVSRDSGETWNTYDLSPYTAMIQDVKFLDENVGFICAGSDPNIERSHAQILKTVDGGKTWNTVYLSKRPLEVIWKCSFPSERVGYATVLSFDDSNAKKVFVKTMDGGDSWREMPLARDNKLQEFGVGFLTEKIGWIGAMDGVWQTTDGGRSWEHQNVGHAINKIRVVRDNKGTSVFGIGLEVIKMDLPRN